MDCTWSNHWLHHNARSSFPYTLSTVELPSKSGNGRLSLSLETTRLCHFCFYNAIENDGHFVMECPIYNPIRHKFPSLFENVVLGSLKSFFQLDYQVDISLYLSKATAPYHSRKLVGLKPSWCTFNPIGLFFSFWDLKMNFISLRLAMDTLYQKGSACVLDKHYALPCKKRGEYRIW